MKVCDLVLQDIEFGKGQLLLVGGRPGMGKSSFARSIAVELAQRGHLIGYFSLELGKEGWFEHISQNRPAAEIANLPIDVLDEVPMSVVDIEKSCAEKNYDLIIVDYLQLVCLKLIYLGKGRNEELIIDFRRLADKFNLPVIILSQLNRREDLKASSIDPELFEQVFLLYRGHYYDAGDDPARMIVVKKNGEEILDYAECEKI